LIFRANPKPECNRNASQLRPTDFRILLISLNSQQHHVPWRLLLLLMSSW
jgi:hypothetical protein